MSTDAQYLTNEKFAELQKELEYLKIERRKEVAEHLEYSKKLGDLSENAEYHQAREEQALVEDRIARLESLLKSAVMIGEGGKEVITIGSSGAIRSYGWVDIPTSATAVTRQSMNGTAQDVTVNTTTNSALTIAATWGTASSSNTITCEGWQIEQLN